VTRVVNNTDVVLQIVKSGDDAVLGTSESTSKDPFIMVKILGKEFMAFLDTGSSVSIIGDEVINFLSTKNVVCHDYSRIINSLQGSVNVNKKVTLTVDYTVGVKRQTFLLVPGSIRTILLGRDFLGRAGVGIFVGKGGWTVGDEMQKLIPFIRNPSQFLLKKLSNLGSEVKEVDVSNEEEVNKDFENILSCLYITPAEALAEIEVPEVESHTFKVKESPLYTDSEIGILVPDILSDEQRDLLRTDLIQFLPIITRRPGLCTLYQHTIDTGLSKPIKEGLRPTSRGKRKIFDITFDELLSYDVIEPSISPWASNAFLVPKPDGELRFVINYKPLNKVTVPDVYPVNRIEDMLAFLGDSSYFTVLDCSKGFHQIEVATKDRQKTAFISHRGLWQFKRMPMGLMNSPATFQRCIDAVLGDLKWSICLCYFDDIIIFSKTFEEHRAHIKAVLSKLKEAGFTIHPNKIQLCRTKLKFLGHIVEPGKVYPNPEKVECIRKYPVPRNKKNIQQFLGLIGFYRKFIPNIALHARPITMLLRDEIEFIWSNECQITFEYLKSVLTDLSELHLPDLNGQFIISTDASRVGLGAVLLQVKDGVRYPIWFASRCLRPAETRYSTPELECLAVIWAIEKFRGYIEYTKFIVETDHQALSWLQRIKEPSGRLAHWFLILQHYQFEVHYKPGCSLNMKAPDALSRMQEIILYLKLDINEPRTTFIHEQDSDDELISVKQFLKGEVIGMNPQEIHRLKKIADRCKILSDGMLMRFVGPKGKPWEDEKKYWRVWVPKSLRVKVMSVAHEDILSAHLGIRKTFLRLESMVYWYGLNRDVSKYVKSCEKCQANKNFAIPVAPATSFRPESPWDLIAMDLMGPFPKGVNQNCYLLVIVDMFTKYVEMFALRRATSDKIIEKVWEVCCRWGVPRVIVTDNGSQFTSNIYLQWCQAVGVETFHIAVYHAQANITERYNETIKGMIVATINKCKEWDKSLPELSFALRTAVNDSTKFTPAYLNVGRELRTPFHNLVNLELSNVRPVKELGNRMILIHNIARDNIIKAQEVYLANYNKDTSLRKFKVGDFVWYKTRYLADAAMGFTPKLAPKRELCKVIFVVSETIYDLERKEDGVKVLKVHVNDLLPYIADELRHEYSPPPPVEPSS
jgi:transposase InsO family protein